MWRIRAAAEEEEEARSFSEVKAVVGS